MNLSEIKAKLKNGELILDEGKLYTLEEWTKIAYAQAQEELYDLLQLTKKIQLNSCYGALLNAGFRFGDERLGASTTGSGRAITTHMIEKIAELLEGKPNGVHVRLIKRYPHPVNCPGGIPKKAGNGAKFVKTLNIPVEQFMDESFFEVNPNGMMPVYRAVVFESSAPDAKWLRYSSVIIYSDTDSCYFVSAGAFDKKSAVTIADETAKLTNESFPEFMREAFLCQPGFDGHIKAGREVVATRGLFQAKKKYMLKVFDLEGKPVDKIKSMGSEIKKADTPRIIQLFLKHTVDMILDGKPYDAVAKYVNEQRSEIIKSSTSMFGLGVAKQVNDMDKFEAEYRNPGVILTDAGRKITIPGHARAALNYNHLLTEYDQGAKTVRSGDKVVVFYLLPNDYKFKAIAFPSEMSRFPEWFSEAHFEVDKSVTEDKMFDNKLGGVFAAWGYEVPTPQSVFLGNLLEF